MKTKFSVLCATAVCAVLLVCTAATCGTKTKDFAGLVNVFDDKGFTLVEDPIATLFSTATGIEREFQGANINKTNDNSELEDIDLAGWMEEGFSVKKGLAVAVGDKTETHNTIVFVIKFDTTDHAQKYEKLVKNVLNTPKSLNEFEKQDVAGDKDKDGNTLDGTRGRRTTAIRNGKIVCASFSESRKVLTEVGADVLVIFDKYYA